MSAFPLGVEDKYKSALFSRTLQLNCLNKNYTALWERAWKEEFKIDTWSKLDIRLKPFNTLSPGWQWHNPLRNYFERRQALVEIDVITAMALGLTLDELILIYNVPVPGASANEDDTWYEPECKGKHSFHLQQRPCRGRGRPARLGTDSKYAGW